MKVNKFNILIALLFITSLVGACNQTKQSSVNPSSKSSDTSITTSTTSVDTTSKQDSHSSEQKSSSSSSQLSTSKSSSSSQKPSSSSNKSSSSPASSSHSSSSSSSQVEPEPISNALPMLESNYELKMNTNTCDNHILEEEIVFKASIISKGVKRRICHSCGGFNEEFYYDLDECVFEDKTYMYDGKAKHLYVEGMIPYDISVQYENNSLTEIGSQEVTAQFITKAGEKIAEKKANLHIVENVGIPRIDVVTENGEDPYYKEKEDYTNMTASVSNAGKWNFSGKTGGIRVRGNSTNQSDVNKRAWRLKFDKKINMLGLNAGPNGKGFKSWVLMADNFDYSYFRNATAFTLGNDLFNHSGNYASHFQHVNLYMNGDYRGIYLVAEQNQANMGRISVNEVEEDTTTYPETGGYPGTDVGYVVEIDGLVTTGQSKEEYKFTTGNGSSSGGWGGWGGFGGGGEQINGVTITDKGYVVKTDVFGEEQFPFVKKYINNVLTIFKNAVKGEKLQILDANCDLIDSPYTTQYQTLNAVMDLDSIFRTCVLQEFCKNFDCGWGSFYLFFDFAPNAIHKRLTCGAPWDFDLGLGNKSNQGQYKPDGDFITKSGGSMTEFNPWLYLLTQTDFYASMFKRYYQAFMNSMSVTKVLQYIDYETTAFATDFANEYAKWGGDSGRNSMSTRKYNSHAEAVSYLTNWLTTRQNYLDNKYGQ